MFLIIGGIVLAAVVVTLFILFARGSKETFNPALSNPSLNPSPATGAANPLFSTDLSTWKSYYWPQKINTHYPSNWQLSEETNKAGQVAGLKITPPTSNPDDTIFVGGASVKCSNLSKYSKSKCLKDKIQIPFYTNSKNQDVLSAFDLILQNTILTEVVK